MDHLEYLEAMGCALWTLAYIILIVRQYRDKSFLLPLPILALNLSWELLHGAVVLWWFPDRVALLFDVSWILLDMILIAQTIYYAQRHYPPLAHAYTLRRFLMLLFPAAAVHVLIDAIANEWTGYYSGYVADLIMFVFVGNLMRSRGTNRGASLWFLCITFAADELMISVFAIWYGFLWFPATFSCCRILTFVYCLRTFLRNNVLLESDGSQ